MLPLLVLTFMVHVLAAAVANIGGQLLPVLPGAIHDALAPPPPPPPICGLDAIHDALGSWSSGSETRKALTSISSSSSMGGSSSIS
jgi:hypothetical protein